MERSNGPAAESGSTTRIGGLMRRVVDVRKGEETVLLLSFSYFMLVLFSYYIIRPIRDVMGTESGIENLAWLFTGTLVAMLVAQPMFGGLVKKLPRRRFIAVAYRFFAINLLLFFLLMRWLPAGSEIWVGRVFYIWTAVFNLFVVSVFWALMADVFARDQGKRLFGLIAVGGTVGAIAGSLVTAVLSRVVDPVSLLLVSAVLLEFAVWCTFAIQRTKLTRDDAETTIASPDVPPERAIGGSVWAGLTHVMRSPYLLGIVGFMLLFTILSTFLYYHQVDIADRYFADRGARTSFFSSVDLAVNVLTLLTQLFLTGRIMKYLGVSVALAFLPVMSVLGFAALAVSPTIFVLVAFYVIRRAGNFAIARPSREVLFTIIPREDKYKAKSFIDTAVYRAGDQVGAWSYTGLSVGLGLTMGGIAVVAIPLAVTWAAIAIWLGRRQAKMAGDQAASARAAARPAVATQ